MLNVRALRVRAHRQLVFAEKARSCRWSASSSAISVAGGSQRLRDALVAWQDDDMQVSMFKIPNMHANA